MNVVENFQMIDSEMRLYGVGELYFETLEELEEYCQNQNLSMKNICILDYLRKFAGRSDVIRICENGKLIFYTAVDEDGYGIFNYERSIYSKTFVWEYCHGEIHEVYLAFRDRGIVFENDVYHKIAERDKQLLKMCREQKLFGMK